MARSELVVALGDHLYLVERPWGTLPQGMQLQFVSHVALDSQDHVYVVQRGKPPVVVFDASGVYVRSWGTDTITDPHGLFVTPDDLVLVVDRDAHQVMEFDTQGHLRLALGERHRPRLQAPFNHPTDVAVAPNGDIYVSDGYGNSTVHRFTGDGEWLQSWGRPGSGPGEFTTPHAIWVEEDGRVLVADRENNRVQIFDGDGEYLGEWTGHYHPMDIYVDRQGYRYITDQVPRLSMLDTDGRLVGRCRPVTHLPHGVWGDSRGNFFLAELQPTHRITKLVRMG